MCDVSGYSSGEVTAGTVDGVPRDGVQGAMEQCTYREQEPGTDDAMPGTDDAVPGLMTPFLVSMRLVLVSMRLVSLVCDSWIQYNLVSGIVRSLILQEFLKKSLLLAGLISPVWPCVDARSVKRSP